MLRRIFASLLLLFFLNSSYATSNHEPNFDFLPNRITNQLSVTQPDVAEMFHKQAIDVVKKALNISAASPYESVRIQFIYDEFLTPKTLIVFLPSTKDKSVEIVKINLTPDMKLEFIQRNYHVTRDDLSQSPNYAYPYQPICPDNSKQFVIGNSFVGHPELDVVVLKVYDMVKENRYNPILMDVYRPFEPQPTVQNYLNWMSCPNVKGFYNESHGSEEGILLSDDFFLYDLVDKNLRGKLKDDVVLFDSCSTFQDPLLSAMTGLFRGNSQQYMAGQVPLPFGSSEKTAACFWNLAIKDHAKLTEYTIAYCAQQSGLAVNAFQIKGNGNQYLRSPV